MSSPFTVRFRSLGFTILVLSFLPSIGLSSGYRFLENGTPSNRGEDTGFLGETPMRLRIDLSGDWSYAVEDGPSGVVKVPGAYDFVGKVTFRRKVEITADQIDNYDFHFVMLGSNYNTEVSINSEFVTNHTGGYTSFIVPIPRNVLQVGGENLVQVTTNNELDAKKTLPLRSLVWSWRNYGGILRDVFILATPKLCINEVQVTSDLASDFSSVHIGVMAGFDGVDLLIGQDPGQGKKAALGFFVEMFDKISGFSVGKSVVMPLAREGDAWARIRADIALDAPKLWSPESAELYLLKCYVISTTAGAKEKETRVIDQYDLNCGVRSLSLTGGDILLNGKRFILKGVIWQEDHPTWGSAMTCEDLEKDVVLIKNLGANAIRFGGHPPHPYMLNLCDRYGLVALEELPVAEVPAAVLAQEEYIDQASTMMREMIVRDRNHPSVLAWGIGDQFESSNPEARGFVEAQVRLAKTLDSRPTYFASRMVSGDACSDLVDIAAVNISTQDQKAFKTQLQA